MSFDLSNLSNDQVRALAIALQKQLESNEFKFDHKVAQVQAERVSNRMKEVERTVVYHETVNAAFEVSLNEILGDLNESRFIVTQLDKCRRENDFRRMNSVYFKYRGKNLKIEEMLKTLCAIYRLKVKNYKNPSDKSADRAIVRHEIRCPDCGEYARKLVEFLDIKGIKWAS